MKTVLKISFLVIHLFMFHISEAFAQKYKPEDFGYRLMKTLYKKDTVDIVVLSKKGEELKKKPVILIERGSLPKPLLVEYTGKGYTSILPFDTRILTSDYHLVFVSKPGVPVICNEEKLTNPMVYNDPKTGLFPAYYLERNHIDYYVGSDAQVLKFLKKQPWVDKSKMVAAGHSEGGPIVAKLATVSKDVTHVISSSSNPFGQLATIMSQIRADEDSAGNYAKEQFEYYKKLINKDKNISSIPGAPAETYFKYLYGFNLPAFDNFQKIKVPVLVNYGTKDYCAPFNDYMHIAMIREKKKNFTFIDYQGLEHNYFKLDEKGEGIPDFAGWTQVAKDWKAWLDKN
jgi:dienelactone hydrolase